MDLNRLEQLENRVADLEKEIVILKQNRPIENQVPPQMTRSMGGQTYQPQSHQPIPYPKRNLEQKETDWEHLIARVWLPRIFMFVLLIGIIWGFKAAVDSGFVTESMRCIIGYAVGIAFVWVGFKQQQANRPLLSQVLLGGSIGLFILSTFAGHVLYELIPAPVAFALNVLWFLLGLWFSHKLGSQALAILASAAGILTPFLVDIDNPSAAFFASFVGYETLLYVGFMLYAIRNRFVGLFYSSFGLLHLALLLYTIGANGDERIIAIGVFTQHIILLVSIFRNSPILKHQLNMLIPSFAFAALWSKTAYTDTQFNIILLAAFVVYAVISGWFWRKAQEKLPLPFTVTLATYALLFATANFFDSDALPGFLLAEGVAALLLGFVIKSSLQKINGVILYAFAFITTWNIIEEGMSTLLSLEMLLWVLLLGTLACLIKIVSHFKVGSHTKDALLILWYGLGLLFLFFITEVTRTLTHDLSSNLQHLLVSTAWVVYAIGVIAYGLMQQSKTIRLTGIALLFLTLMKVIFMDLPSVSLMVKAVLFIGLGFIGILLSRFFYKKE